jgi:hypothetical protein
MKEFIRLNPSFGRKIQTAHNPNRPRQFGQRDSPRFHIEVISNHSRESFLGTHQYNDNIYNRFIQYGILTEPEDAESTEPASSTIQGAEPNTAPVFSEESEDSDGNEEEDEENFPIIQDDDEMFRDIYSASDDESETESDMDE